MARPDDFDYFRAGTIGEAVQALAASETATALAGGQSLIPLLRLRLARPTLVVDIGHISGLAGIGRSNGDTDIGALTTVAALDHVEQRGLLEDVAGVIGDPLVRNFGTVGGNLAHADPQNDLPAAFVAAGGRVTVRGLDGERTIAAEDLFVDAFTTSLRAGELITAIHFPAAEGGAYEKLKPAAVGVGVIAVAAQLTFGDDGAVRSAGVAVTGCTTVAPRSAGAEQTLVGTGADIESVRRAAAVAAEEAPVAGDERGSERYKRALVAALTERALRRAIKRSGRTPT